MKNSVFIATSLDGYIADKNDSIEWLLSIPNPDEEDAGYKKFISGIDAIIMGRKTFNTVAGFNPWPYTKPVFVLSSTLLKIPESLQNKAEQITGSPINIVEHLNKRGYNNLYIDGGNTIQGFLAANLIDELIITRIPIVLGGGASLFGKLDVPQYFKHVKTKVFLNLMVQSCYERIM